MARVRRQDESSSKISSLTDDDTVAIRRGVKAELDAARAESGEDGRLHLCMKRIEEFAELRGGANVFQYYTYIISALVTHVRVPCLDEKMVIQLLKVAEATVRTQGISERVSRFSYMFSDLHQLKSQLLRMKGQHWSSCWEELLATYSLDYGSEVSDPFMQLSLGNRLLRLGYIEEAIAAFDQAISGVLPKESMDRALLGKVIALRVSGQWERGGALVEQSLAGDTLLEASKTEMRWNRALIEAQQAGGVEALAKAVKNAKSGFSHPDYGVEASLWILASPDRRLMKELPLVPRKKLRTSAKGGAIVDGTAILNALLDYYDSSSPLSWRLAALGTALEEAEKCIYIDRAMVCWAAAARALHRSKQYQFAQVCRGEYKKLCRQVSAGTSEDVFNFQLPLRNQTQANDEHRDEDAA